MNRSTKSIARSYGLWFVCLFESESRVIDTTQYHPECHVIALFASIPCAGQIFGNLITFTVCKITDAIGPPDLPPPSSLTHGLSPLSLFTETLAPGPSPAGDLTPTTRIALILTFLLCLLVATLMAVRLPDVVHSITAHVSLWHVYWVILTARLSTLTVSLSRSCCPSWWTRSWLVRYWMISTQSPLK